tara:strand:+ start:1047 stop:1925 length:879 start_codon:yes stop_codon:yes gene_type:complete
MAMIIPGIVFLIIAGGLKTGIDFTGGSSMQIQFSDDVSQEDLRIKLEQEGYINAVVQGMGENVYFLRTVTVNEENKSKLLKSLEGSLSPSGVQVLSFDTVSPLVAGEIVRAAIWAVIAAAVGIFLYLWWAFRNVPSPIRYGCAAIVALIHDVLIVIGVFALLGYLWEIEVNSMFLIAVLTIIGYSVNDTIVVFDRLRENIILYPNRKFENNVSVSIFETLGRSLNTSFTLLFTLLALILFGGQTIREFLWVLLIGVIVGTYSSIGVATQVLVVWEKGLIKKIFKRETIGSTA